MEGVSGAAGVGCGNAVVGEVGVKMPDELTCDGVIDRPQGADDVLVAGKVEGAGDVDGLIGERKASDGGVAGGQESEAAIEVAGADVGDPSKD